MEFEEPCVAHHIAVRLDHYIVVIGKLCGRCNDANNIQAHRDTVWQYNIFLERWKKYQINEKKQVPCYLSGACGAVIGRDIYTFGGQGGRPYPTNYYNNELWKLRQNNNGNFEWNRILMKNKKTPYPRSCHSGWEYDGKLWTFGGYGHVVVVNNYLNEHGDFVGGWNNQLLHFDPVSNEWINLKCFGAVPSPQAPHATTVREDKVWLYSNLFSRFDIDFDPIYQLDMCSLTWTQIQTATPKPPRARACTCSLNVTRENQLVLRHGKRHDALEHTWILDLSSYSWKKCSYNDSFRIYHTGSLGINNSIIIIGGTFDWDRLRLNKCAPMCKVMLEPKSLQQLSIQTVYKHQHQLPWMDLPKKLIKLMQ